MLYEDPGHSSALHSIQKEPCDFRLREQEVSPIPVIFQELRRVCVLRSWSGISEGKAVVTDGGCQHFLSDPGIMEYRALCPLFSCAPSTRSLCTTGVASHQ